MHTLSIHLSLPPSSAASSSSFLFLELLLVGGGGSQRDFTISILSPPTHTHLIPSDDLIEALQWLMTQSCDSLQSCLKGVLTDHIPNEITINSQMEQTQCFHHVQMSPSTTHHDQLLIWSTAPQILIYTAPKKMEAHRAE